MSAGAPTSSPTGAGRALHRCSRASTGEIPVRESRAIINAVRVRANAAPLVTTVTDVLRLACELSGGDASLRTATRFRSLPRRQRETLVAALDAAIGADTPKLADVNQHAERWKRLGERIHPHEFDRYPQAQAVFAVARGEKRARSLAGQVELAFADGNVRAAAVLAGHRAGDAMAVGRPAAAQRLARPTTRTMR